MLKRFTYVASALLLTFAGAAHADDSTDYDEGLSGFVDLKAGQRVEIDFDYDGERHLVTEIEQDD